MIPKSDIDHLKQNASILDVASSMGISVQKNGSIYKGCCPLHNEKTPSFVIYPNSNRFVCFGCGETGNAIDLVLKIKRCTFIEAVKYVAETVNYELQEDYQETEEDKNRRAKAESIIEINKLAMQWFCNQLPKNSHASEYASGRWKQDTIMQWSIGYAPDDFGALYNYLRNEKKVRYDYIMSHPLFATSKNGSVYCRFRNRIMFPVFSSGNEPVAFCGRYIGTDTKSPKYINSTDTEDVYTKGDCFFGWNYAWSEAHRKDEIILVEGNPDVIKMHEIGISNVVAACGTSLTKKHIDMLKKHVANVVLLYDNDNKDDGSNPGQQAAENNGAALMNEGLNVYNITIAAEKGEKQDPDTFFKDKKHFEVYASNCKKPYVVFLAERIKHRCTDPTSTAAAIDRIAKFLIGKSESESIGYIDRLSKIIPPKKIWTAAIKNLNKKNEEEVRANEYGLNDEQMNMAKVYGFFVRKNSYKIIRSQDGAFEDVSNFVMKPLFHIESSTAAKRLYRIENNMGLVRDIEIAQKDLVSKSAFCTCVESRGNFLFTGSDRALAKIKGYLYENTKTCNQIDQLGWQKAGFWAWCNGIVTKDGTMIPIDDLGTVQYGGQWYYLPGLSSTTKNDVSFYQFERNFINQESDASLFIFADKVRAAYGTNGIITLCYYFAVLFRDIIFEKFDGFPLLNIFGQKGTGKTKLITSFLRLFGERDKGVNIDSATPAAIADHISHCRNALVHIDEYKNSVDYNKIDILKGVYDGTGRTRINIDKDRKKETTAVDCGVVLTGQEMTTADNALFSRVIYLTLNNTKFSAQQRADFEDLKEYEKKGLTSITNSIITLREVVEKNYERNYEQTKEEIKQAINTREIETRILENWVMVLAVLRTIDNHVELPFHYDTVFPLFTKGIETQNEAVKDSNEIGNFWRAVESMLTNGDIETEYDIKTYMGRSGFKLWKGSGKDRKETTYTQKFDVVYINPDRIFNAYARLQKATKDKHANIMNEESLRHYLMNQDEYMGECPTSFKVPIKNRQNPNEGVQYMGSEIIRALRKTSRALVFNYAKLIENYGVNFEISSEDNRDDNSINTLIPNDDEE